ncbi:MAG TPA: metal ABC transporter permease [Actinomycetota bacterium]|nr:metal ABC transporter permease [Actinomycetota bacterium]
MIRLLIEPFQVAFMQRALLAVLVLGVLAGAVGVFVVLRRLAFVGDALTHAVFPGVVVAFLVGQSIFLGALAAALLSAVLLTGLTSTRRVTPDAGLAILLTSFFAVGVVLVSREQSYTADLSAFLFGRILAVDWPVLWQTIAVAVVVLGTLLVLRKELLLRAFDPDGAAAMGYRVGVLDLVLNVLVALVVVAAVKAVGTVLVIALIIVPAATSRLLAERVAPMTAISCALGALGGWLGLAISYDVSIQRGVRLAAGATIVVVLVACFLVALAVGPARRAVARLAGGGPTAGGPAGGHPAAGPPPTTSEGAG